MFSFQSTEEKIKRKKMKIYILAEYWNVSKGKIWNRGNIFDFDVPRTLNAISLIYICIDSAWENE